MKLAVLAMCAFALAIPAVQAQDKPAEKPAAKPEPAPTIDPVVRGNYFKANAEMRYFQQRAEGSKTEVDAYTQAMRVGCTKPGYHFEFNPQSDEPGCVVDPPKPVSQQAEPEKKK